MHSPDYLFEVSWEVVNKVGGIYTVITTKHTEISKHLTGQHIYIGPDIIDVNEEKHGFIPDESLYTDWCYVAGQEGLKIKIGRWDIPGQPAVILVDYTQFYELKNEIFTEMWLSDGVDSLTESWDYIEPAIFGYACARVIKSFYDYHCTANHLISAHFHEWMTASGVLYLRKHCPQVSTIFTTHATVLGRSIAGNGLGLYDNLENFNPAEIAARINVSQKHSLERAAAHKADAFTTVSHITGREAKNLLQKEPDAITPNGINDNLIPSADDLYSQRIQARERLIMVANAVLQCDGAIHENLPENTLFVSTSGRYEFRNKGLDVFFDALKKLKDENHTNKGKPVVAFIHVPARNLGPRNEIIQKITEDDTQIIPEANQAYCTHRLMYPEGDAVLDRIKGDGLNHHADSGIYVIFAPVYLDGHDGIFNFDYYKLLSGFDLTVYASYYEPWGYTPLESIAFGVPTVTTDKAGFGDWVLQNFGAESGGVRILKREEYNSQEVSDAIASEIVRFLQLTDAEVGYEREQAARIASEARWEKFIDTYLQAYDIAGGKVEKRKETYSGKRATISNIPVTREALDLQPGPNWRPLIVEFTPPKGFEFLDELSMNLWWTWNYQAKELFQQCNPELWSRYDHNPVRLLRGMSVEDFERLNADQNFKNNLEVVKELYDSHMKAPKSTSYKVAYMSMEYGFHHTIKLYSGGLGVLAGDYLKEASDKCVDMIAFGLFYRKGYFRQNLTIDGQQVAEPDFQDFGRLPVKQLIDSSGNPLKIRINYPGRVVTVYVWLMQVGRVPLYLFDTDHDENEAFDRTLTHQLYAGDNEFRLMQEIILGRGGVMLVEQLNLQPDIYHLNEGHAALSIFQRLIHLVSNKGLNYYEALEVIKSNTLFTTHTPVPAGHDAFSEDMMRKYGSNLEPFFNVRWDEIMSLGRFNPKDHKEKFSLSILACKASGDINGVSALHGEVSREMFNAIWSGYSVAETPIGHVTNGVHSPTWTAKEFQKLYEKKLGINIRDLQAKPELYEKVNTLDDLDIWDTHMDLKSKFISHVGENLTGNLLYTMKDAAKTIRIYESLQADRFMVGFARRFATYKRATLIFRDLEKLSELVNDPQRPVQFIFAGKAHPNDKAGQDFIRHIIHVSEMAEFAGKVIFLPNYDMKLAKRLVQGVDLWLNTPTRPLEASGTSGMKATLNGVLNFSVLDGWWDEGYRPDGGWSLPKEARFADHEQQDALDSEMIYATFKNEIIPAYYNRGEDGMPHEWIARMKVALTGIGPEFTMRRQLNDYQSRYYEPLATQHEFIAGNHYQNARELVKWKNQIALLWPRIEVTKVEISDSGSAVRPLDKPINAAIELNFHGISAEHVEVSMIVVHKDHDGHFLTNDAVMPMEHSTRNRHFDVYKCSFYPQRAGIFQFGFRILPKHPLLRKSSDFAIWRWI